MFLLMCRLVLKGLEKVELTDLHEPCIQNVLLQARRQDHLAQRVFTFFNLFFFLLLLCLF